ncbi:DUF3592 domain-containing protein [Streptomyces sp. NBC_00582]|uniref:DUF3592 domain-containing protein n=1 Tax=Streptomyces sp. NBC_00582 TaxID=2975783 RepID=UPI0010E10B43|nr:DUF3592 domain-containing protein [Streptomyces sp. NBC_00582]WUB64361.1 DUF3592 domain-containing protein [Streptomyces sp. NBC_00582]
MDVFFLIVPSIMIAGILFAMYTVISRSRRATRAWGSGLTAEARCLRTYTTTRTGGGEHRRVTTVLHHVYEFTTREGRAVRFEEENGPGTTLEGDIVTVFYPADRPEQATAHPPAHGRLFAESGCLLVFLGVALAFCVAFMIGAQTEASGWSDVAP